MPPQETPARILRLPLQGRLDALRDELEARATSPEVVAVMRRVTDDLIASGQAERALKAGDDAPAFSLPDLDGKLVASNDLLARGPLVLTFYRGTWCPFCDLELAALEEARPEIEKRRALLAAVSAQTAASSRQSRRMGDLRFPILTDKDGALAHRFGLRWKIPEDLKRVHRLLNIDMGFLSGECSGTLPMPARYVIGQDGVVAYAEVNSDYTRRPDPSDLFPVLDALGRARTDGLADRSWHEPSA